MMKNKLFVQPVTIRNIGLLTAVFTKITDVNKSLTVSYNIHGGDLIFVVILYKNNYSSLSLSTFF